MFSLLLGASEVLVVAAIIVGVLGLGVLGWHLERKRRRLLCEALRGIGIEAPLEADNAAKHGAFERLGPFRDLRTGATGVIWCAEGSLDGHAVTLVEHRYTSGSGKNKRTHYHTVAACPRPGGTAWPRLRLVDEHIFHKIAEMFGSKDLRVESEAFNKRWRVTTDDPDFATLVLSQDVQEWSLTLARNTEVRVGRGGVALAIERKLDAAPAVALVRACAALASRIPPELDAWGGATPA